MWEQYFSQNDVSHISSEIKAMCFLTLLSRWNDSWTNRRTVNAQASITREYQFSLGSPFLFYVPNVPTPNIPYGSRSCESVLCSTVLSDSHDSTCWNAANLPCFLLPLAGVKASDSRSLGYWCRQGLEQRTTTCVTLEISVNCPGIQLMKGKQSCSH